MTCSVCRHAEAEPVKASQGSAQICSECGALWRAHAAEDVVARARDILLRWQSSNLLDELDVRSLPLPRAEDSSPAMETAPATGVHAESEPAPLEPLAAETSKTVADEQISFKETPPRSAPDSAAETTELTEADRPKREDDLLRVELEKATVSSEDQAEDSDLQQDLPKSSAASEPEPEPPFSEATEASSTTAPVEEVSSVAGGPWPDGSQAGSPESRPESPVVNGTPKEASADGTATQVNQLISAFNHQPVVPAEQPETPPAAGPTAKKLPESPPPLAENRSEARQEPAELTTTESLAAVQTTEKMTIAADSPEVKPSGNLDTDVTTRTTPLIPAISVGPAPESGTIEEKSTEKPTNEEPGHRRPRFARVYRRSRGPQLTGSIDVNRKLRADLPGTQSEKSTEPVEQSSSTETTGGPGVRSNSVSGRRTRIDHGQPTESVMGTGGARGRTHGRRRNRYIDEPHDMMQRGPHFEVAPVRRSAMTSVIGQFLAYSGVLGLTVGTAMVIYGHFGGYSEYTPTGWLVTTVAQMLLFLGVINLVSGGIEQNNEDVSRRIHSLGEQLMRIEQVTEQSLRGPRIPMERYMNPEAPAEESSRETATTENELS